MTTLDLSTCVHAHAQAEQGLFAADTIMIRLRYPSCLQRGNGDGNDGNGRRHKATYYY